MNEIPQSDFDNLQTKLKGCDSKWASVLAGKIDKAASSSEDPAHEKFKGMNRKKVYNIFTGVVKDLASRLFVYEQGLLYLSEFSGKVEQLTSATNP